MRENLSKHSQSCFVEAHYLIAQILIKVLNTRVSIIISVYNNKCIF